MVHDLKTLDRHAIAAAKKRIEEPAWGTVCLTVFCLSLLLLTLWLAVHQRVPAWFAGLLFAMASHLAYTPLHEAAHRNIHGRHKNLNWLNDLCGYVAAQITWLPHSSHRFEHLTHHRYTNDPEKDPDYLVKTMGDGPVAFFTTASAFSWNQMTYVFKEGRQASTNRDRILHIVELMAGLLWRIGFISQVSLIDGLTIVLIGYYGSLFFLVYWFAYRPHLPYRETARYRNTNSILLPAWLKPFEWFLLGQSLHSIHHLFPRVPFYRYAGLYREIESVMKAHEAPVVNLFSRTD